MNIMNNKEKIRLAYGSTLMDGGYTIWDSHDECYKGYIIGGVEHGSSCDKHGYNSFTTLYVEYAVLLTENLFRESLLKYKEGLQGGTLIERVFAFGTWLKGGQIHFDVVEWVETKGEAEKLAIKRGQKAYYDVLNKKDIHPTKL